MVVYNKNGAERGRIRLDLDFDANTWSLVEDRSRLGPMIASSPCGAMDVNATEVGIKSQFPGRGAGLGKIITSDRFDLPGLRCARPSARLEGHDGSGAGARGSEKRGLGFGG